MTTWAPGALTPRPDAAPFPRMLAAQARAELTLLLRNGEQILLTLVIPLGLLVVLSKASFVTVPTGGDRIGFFVPGVMALAVMSTAFTGQAIGVGFERQYGVLKRLGATPLPRSVLLGAKTLAVLAVEVVQLTLIALVGKLLGWHPHGSVLSVLLLVALGTAAFSGLGLLLGGTLRGLTSLAAANLLWFLLLILGGVLFPLTHFGGTEPVVRLLPTAALAHGLREALQHGATLPARDLLALAAWATATLTAAARWFRWD
ncbi:MAG: type transport system permease protein [Actinomycetota bacterium]|jgi:ABC-2 type transport system permease protein|nr:type transport system permease protein [Actinomycetota bacterium]